MWASQELGHRVVCYVEREPYCVQVLQARIADGSFPDAPIWDDVFTFDGHPWRGRVDLISAGFPCQPFSVAGAQLGADDPRNGWPATARIIREVRPRYVFLENVPGLLAGPGTGANGYFGIVLGQLAEFGYDIQWSCLSAEDVGAPHKRNRLWILGALADADRSRKLQQKGRLKDVRGRPRNGDSQGRQASDARCKGLQGHGNGAIGEAPQHARAPESSWWAVEPEVVRVVHGLAKRGSQIKCLGNGQVPQCAVAAFNGLMQRQVKQ